jgi:elongation of very long chain fatty acids protein 4
MEYVEALVDGYLTRTRDERTIGWPLVDFYPALGAAAFYCVLVFVLPRVLRSPAAKPARKSAGDEETNDLRSIRLVYNGLMSLFNLYLVIEMARQAALTSWFGAITPGEQGMGMVQVLYLYYLSKAVEWIDTIIMIVRGAHRQLTFLHVYHHVGTFLVWRFQLAYYPGGETYPPALLNSLVHVVMYYYYFQSTRGIQPWWKMYLTRLQISQLFSFVILGLFATFTANPKHRYVGAISGFFAFTLLVLFFRFYFASYGRRSPSSSSLSSSTSAARRKEE